MGCISYAQFFSWTDYYLRVKFRYSYLSAVLKFKHITRFQKKKKKIKHITPLNLIIPFFRIKFNYS